MSWCDVVMSTDIVRRGTLRCTYYGRSRCDDCLIPTTTTLCYRTVHHHAALTRQKSQAQDPGKRALRCLASRRYYQCLCKCAISSTPSVSFTTCAPLTFAGNSSTALLFVPLA